jgi:vitamin B12 transporter
MLRAPCAPALASLLVALPSLAFGASSPRAPDVAAAPLRQEAPVERFAGSVTVIGREEIERRGWQTLPELLREVPGVHVAQSGGPGKQTSVFTRGTESDHTLVLLDGMKISDPSNPGGTFDPAHFLLKDVERVEIVRGPQGSLWGADALGGVIHIVTRRGEGRARLAAEAEAGAFGTTRFATGIYGGDARVDYSLGFNSLHTRGITAASHDFLGGHERDGYDNRTLSGRLGARLSDAVGVGLIGRFIDTENELDPFFESRTNRGSTRQLLTRGETEVDLWGGRWSHRLAATYVDHDRKDQDDDAGLASSLSTHDGARFELEWLQDLDLAPGQVATFGLETEEERIESRSRSPFGDSSAKANARTTSAFLQHRFELLGGRVFGAAGGRLDHHEDYGSEPTARISLGTRLPRLETLLKGSYGTGFRPPTLFDLFGRSAFFVGNRNLDPERSGGFELGVEQPLLEGRVRVGTTYFNQRVRDLIEFRFGNPSTLVNVDRARIDGIESFVSLELIERLHVRLDHTYLSAEDDESGEDLLRRPAHTLRALLEVRPVDAITLGVSVLQVGRRKDIHPVNFSRFTTGEYRLWNLFGSLRLTDRLRIFGRIDNLLDEEYDDPAGFESPGIAGYLGIGVEL